MSVISALKLSRGTVILLSIVALVLGIPTLFGVVTGFDRTTAGEIAVVRDGGPLDDNRIRMILDPASGNTWIGLWSEVHKYPAQQRYYTITSDHSRGDRGGVDVVTVPSSDGVNMGVEGTLYFTLSQDHKTLSSFDDRFGTRKFKFDDGENMAPWEGEDGWSAFLNQIVRPVIDNALRQQIGSFRCAELMSSCALVQNAGSGGQAVDPKDLAKNNNNANISKVQEAINKTLETDMAKTLGGAYLEGMRFNLTRVQLPEKVQDAVDVAQAAFAKVSEAQAKIAQGKAEADANRARQRGYDDCKTCAEIEKLKALPQGITVYAPGNKGGVAVPAK